MALSCFVGEGGKNMTHTKVIKKYSQMIYALAMSRTAQPSDAEDITQDVFLKYLEYDKKFHNEEHLKAWLIRVTINLTINQYRAHDSKKGSASIRRSSRV